MVGCVRWERTNEIETHTTQCLNCFEVEVTAQIQIHRINNCFIFLWPRSILSSVSCTSLHTKLYAQNKQPKRKTSVPDGSMFIRCSHAHTNNSTTVGPWRINAMGISMFEKYFFFFVNLVGDGSRTFGRHEENNDEQNIQNTQTKPPAPITINILLVVRVK